MFAILNDMFVPLMHPKKVSHLVITKIIAIGIFPDQLSGPTTTVILRRHLDAVIDIG
jgi:hypothetical protein